MPNNTPKLYAQRLIERIDKAIQSLPAKQYLPLFLVFVILPAIGALLGFSTYVETILKSGVTVVSKAGDPANVDISPLITWTVLGLLILAIYLSATQLRQSDKIRSRLRRALRRASRRRIDLAEKRSVSRAYNNTVVATDRVCNRMFGSPKSIRHNYIEIHSAYRVDKDGTTVVTKDLVVKAMNEPVHYLKTYIDGQPYAEPCPTYESILFRVKSLDDNSVAFLSTADGPLRKDFAIFFLPVIPPGQERKIQISYKWPKFFSGLNKKGFDEFYWDNRGADRTLTTNFSAAFDFDKSFGDLFCEITGHKPPTTKISRKKDAASIVIKLEDKNLPVPDRAYKVVFKRKTGAD